MEKILYSNINLFNKNELLDFYNSMNQDRKRIIQKNKKEEDKLMSILGDYLLTKLLKEVFNIDYKDVIFKYNKYNKPYIVNHKIYFNISHTNGFVACIVSNSECGIDIEIIRHVDLKIINTFATLNEKKYILNSKHDTYYRLFKIYTLKEAYLKMLGSSIININNIEIMINKNKIYSLDNNISFKSIKKDNLIISTCIKKDS